MVIGSLALGRAELITFTIPMFSLAGFLAPSLLWRINLEHKSSFGLSSIQLAARRVDLARDETCKLEAEKSARSAGRLKV